MTHEELYKLPFRWVSHISLATENMAVYQAETPKGSIVIQTHTRKRKNGEFGKSKMIYFFRAKRFESVDELLKYYNGTE